MTSVSPRTSEQPGPAQEDVGNALTAVSHLSPLFLQFQSWLRLQEVTRSLDEQLKSVTPKQLEQVKKVHVEKGRPYEIAINPILPNYEAFLHGVPQGGRVTRSTLRTLNIARRPSLTGWEAEFTTSSATRKRSLPDSKPEPEGHSPKHARTTSPDDKPAPAPAPAPAVAFAPRGATMLSVNWADPSGPKLLCVFKLNKTPTYLGRKGSQWEREGKEVLNIKVPSGKILISHCHAVFEFNFENKTWTFTQFGMNPTHIGETIVNKGERYPGLKNATLKVGQCELVLETPENVAAPSLA
eukprot:m51a1_g6693 hypothetical protein (297) ;mRNA; r:77993-79314